MVCIYCGGPTQVSNSRLQKKLNRVWRRRICLRCHNVFTTSEIPTERLALMVGRKPHKPVPYSRDKLFISIYESCKHRKTAIQDASALADAVTASLLQTDHQGVLDHSTIQQITFAALERFDGVAAVHYRAYYYPA